MWCSVLTKVNEMLRIIFMIMVFQSWWLSSVMHEFRLPTVLSVFLIIWANMGTAFIMRVVWILFLIILDEEIEEREMFGEYK